MTLAVAEALNPNKPNQTYFIIHEPGEPFPQRLPGAYRNNDRRPPAGASFISIWGSGKWQERTGGGESSQGEPENQVQASSMTAPTYALPEVMVPSYIPTVYWGVIDLLIYRAYCISNMRRSMFFRISDNMREINN